MNQKEDRAPKYNTEAEDLAAKDRKFGAWVGGLPLEEWERRERARAELVPPESRTPRDLVFLDLCLSCRVVKVNAWGRLYCRGCIKKEKKAK